MFPCQAPRGFPVPRVTWKYNGRDLSLTGRLALMDEGNLVISHVRQSDAGQYICSAENLAGSKEAQHSDLTVRAPPVFEVQPQDVTALADDKAAVVFECRATGVPQPQLTWLRSDGRAVGKEERIKFPGDGSLRIERVASVDEGRYTCAAQNEAGVVRSDATLTVHIRPNFLWVPRDQRVTINGTVSFDCLASGNPPPAVFWTKEGSQILMFPGQPHGRYSVQSDGRLVIDKVEQDDTGLYVCSALSVAGSAVVKAYLEVSPVAHGPPPIIKIGAANQTLAIGSVAVLPCEASGASSIRWQKDGVVLSVSTNPRVMVHDSGMLQISDLRIIDTGIFTCIASSPTGETRWSSALIVESPANHHVTFHRMPDVSTFPAAPSKPQIINITETTVELQWWPVLSVNKAGPIKVYRVEYFSPDTPGSWTVASSSLVNSRTTVRNLHPDTSYIFLVRASNLQGLSPPSPTSDSVRTLATARPLPNYDPILIKNVLSQDLVELSEATALSSTSITLHWNILQEEKYISHFNISIRPVGSAFFNSSSKRYFVSFWKGSTESHTLFGLNKFTPYDFTLTPYYKNYAGKTSKIVTGQTLEDVPDEAPQAVNVNLVNLTTISVNWSPPPSNHINGRLAGYRVFIIPTGSVPDDGNIHAPNQIRNVSVDQVEKTNEVIGNLTTGMRYRVTVAARTDAGLGVFSRPLYIRMEPTVSGTGDLLREPWFIASLGGVLFLFLTAFCTMLFLKRKTMKLHEKDQTYPFKRSQSAAMQFHPGQSYRENGTLLPNSIVGLGDGNGHGFHQHLYPNGWINREGIWDKSDNLTPAERYASTLENSMRTHSETRDRSTCPVHGCMKTSYQNTSLNGKGHNNHAVPPTAEPEGLTSATSTTSSKGRSYPETISVSSQRSTPRSQRSSPPKSGLVQPNQAVVNWSDFIPPPPNCPPPASMDKYSISSCQDESDGFSPGMEYVSHRYGYRKKYSTRPPEDYINRDHDSRVIIQRQMEMARERRYLMAQMSLDRSRFGNRERSRDDFVYQFVNRNLQRARSCESSIAYDDDESRTDMSSENDTESVNQVDGENAETSPCLSSEASFFLETDFVEAVKKAAGISSGGRYLTHSVTEAAPRMLKMSRHVREKPTALHQRITKVNTKFYPENEKVQKTSGNRTMTSDGVRRTGLNVMTLPLKKVMVKSNSAAKELPFRPRKNLPKK